MAQDRLTLDFTWKIPSSTETLTDPAITKQWPSEDAHVLIPEPVTYMVKGPYGVTKDSGMERESVS